MHKLAHLKFGEMDYFFFCHTNALLVIVLIKPLKKKKKKDNSNINLFWKIKHLCLMGHIHQAWFSCMTATWSICLFNLNSHCEAIAEKELGRKAIPLLRESNTVCFNKHGETTGKREVLLLNTQEWTPYIRTFS